MAPNIAGPRVNPIRGNETPDPSWNLTGEIIQTRQGGKPVYYVTEPNYIKVPKRGPDGEEIWVKHPQTGTPMRPIYELVRDPKQPIVRREFILWDEGNGIVKKNYHFRADPGEADRKAMRLGQTPRALQEEVQRLREMVAQLTAASDQATIDLPALDEAEDEVLDLPDED